MALFRALGMPEGGRGRQAESGQLLLDRRRHWLTLEWALRLNLRDDLTFRLAYGDKVRGGGAAAAAAEFRD